jgi:hypothetical protein
MADVKKALTLLDIADKTIDEHWHKISLEWIVAQLAEIRAALEKN